jgi:hypothetical protein
VAELHGVLLVVLLAWLARPRGSEAGPTPAA